MPTDNRFGFDDNKRRTPIVPEFGQPDPEDAFGATEPSVFTYTLIECELLPESEVFEDERLPSYAGGPDNSHDRRKKGRHLEAANMKL